VTAGSGEASSITSARTRPDAGGGREATALRRRRRLRRRQDEARPAAGPDRRDDAVAHRPALLARRRRIVAEQERARFAPGELDAAAQVTDHLPVPDRPDREVGARRQRPGREGEGGRAAAEARENIGPRMGDRLRQGRAVEDGPHRGRTVEPRRVEHPAGDPARRLDVQAQAQLRRVGAERRHGVTGPHGEGVGRSVEGEGRQVQAEAVPAALAAAVAQLGPVDPGPDGLALQAVDDQAHRRQRLGRERRDPALEHALGDAVEVERVASRPDHDPLLVGAARLDHREPELARAGEQRRIEGGVQVDGAVLDESALDGQVALALASPGQGEADPLGLRPGIQGDQDAAIVEPAPGDRAGRRHEPPAPRLGEVPRAFQDGHVA
jgi:hypothetical protein